MVQENEISEIIALKAISYIFEHENYQAKFLANSGLAITDLNPELLKRPETLAAILDFVLESDEILLGFCSTTAHNPQEVWRARQALPGFPVH